MLTFGQSTRHVEEKAPPAIRIAGIRPGGIVDIVTPKDPDPQLVRMPSKIYALYLPASDTPLPPEITPEALLSSGAPVGAVDVPPSGGNLVCHAQGVKPGDFDVQLLNEWAD